MVPMTIVSRNRSIGGKQIVGTRRQVEGLVQIYSRTAPSSPTVPLDFRSERQFRAAGSLSLHPGTARLARSAGGEAISVDHPQCVIKSS
jgi:hypothetical protein